MADPSLKIINQYLEAFVDKKGWQMKGRQMLQNFAILYCGGIIHHMLKDAGHLPQSVEDVAKCIEFTVSGKRIMEIGCRAGAFLEFLKEHGAIVAGSTSSEYWMSARERLGGDVIIAEKQAEDVGEDKKLKDFKADVIISLNLFDKGRWSGKTVPYNKIYDSIKRLGSQRTIIYMDPSLEVGSVLKGLRARYMKKKWTTDFDLLRKDKSHRPNSKSTHTLRFRLK